jgi:predicted MFS family arabinose efflux permease
LAVLFVATSLAPNFWIALGMVFGLGASSVVFKSLASTWLQLTADPAMRGRVLAMLVVAIAGTTPIGAPFMGWVSEQFGTRATFALAGVCAAIAAVGVHLYVRRAADGEVKPLKRQNNSVPPSRLRWSPDPSP